MKVPDEGIDKAGIEEISEQALKEANVYGVFPTRIDKLTENLKLSVSFTNLKTIEPSYINGDNETLEAILLKVRGLVNVPNREIFVDNTSTVFRQKFVTLHEVGHVDLPWQRRIFELSGGIGRDYDTTLSLSCHNALELEASHYAASTIFQGNVSKELIYDKPLTMEEIDEVANTFGASFHATVRRFIEFSSQKGALLILRKNSLINGNGGGDVIVHQFFLSESFKQSYSSVNWKKKVFSLRTPFVLDVFDSNITRNTGIFEYMNIPWKYGYYTDGYNHFLIVSEA